MRRFGMSIGLLWVACCVTAAACSKENDVDSTTNINNQSGGDASAADGGSAGEQNNGGTGGAPSGGSGGGGTSGQGGSSTDGGTGGSPADAGFDASTEGCPLGVGPMIRVPEGFCIDVTEVTRARYEPWLLQGPHPTLPPECSFKGTDDPKLVHKPGADEWPPADKPDHPVVAVDWCDAWAYCQGVGKRLCGAVGSGAAADFYSHDAASADEWYAACSAGGNHDFPYGSTYDETACHDRCVGTDCLTALQPVQTAPGCLTTAAGYAGLADMSGNAWEWENSCEAETGSSDDCRVRGGSVFSQWDTALECADEATFQRSARTRFIGFRCCATPTN